MMGIRLTMYKTLVTLPVSIMCNLMIVKLGLTRLEESQRS